MKKKKLIKELAKTQEELRRMWVRYDTSMDRVVEAQSVARLTNPYVFLPPQSIKIADEMKSTMDENRKEEVKAMHRLVMKSLDPRWGWIKHKESEE